jgi:predicted RNA-binding Zn ribbon-like protein
MSRAERAVTDDGLDWSWTHDRELDCLIWPIVRSAVDAVAGADFSRIKQCTGHDGSCGWLFHDTSKNGLRRWCSMQACGTWKKSRRHTEHRAQRRAEPDGR